MNWFFVLGSLVLFLALECLAHMLFTKNRKISEALSIITFLLCAWLITDEYLWMKIVGVVLIVIAIFADLYRRQVMLNS